ncbi:hypothetical protein ASF44_17790 [Pseudorhodoferax sp. Leaf274]|nr:hypothetical protein ASF44_17790 [Pseudorhodoferax sp. Leaf274]
MLTAVRVARLPQWFEEFGPRLADRLGARLSARLNKRLRRSPSHVAPASVRPAPALRVLRVFEPHQPRAAAGRMVISGRMADVCAELDRLAAAESAPARH